MCLFGNLISKSTVPCSCWHQGPVKSPLLTVEFSKWLWEEMSPGQELAESCKGLFNMFSLSWSVCINHIQEQTISRKPSTSICFCKARCLPWFQDGSGWCLIHACIYEKWSPKIWKKTWAPRGAVGQMVGTNLWLKQPAVKTSCCAISRVRVAMMGKNCCHPNEKEEWYYQQQHNNNNIAAMKKIT